MFTNVRAELNADDSPGEVLMSILNANGLLDDKGFGQKLLDSVKGSCQSPAAQAHLKTGCPCTPIEEQATLPMVSSPGSPGTSAGTASVDADAPSTPVVTDKKVSTAAPVQETREADANILLMLKKTTDSPTEDESEQDVLNKTVAV